MTLNLLQMWKIATELNIRKVRGNGEIHTQFLLLRVVCGRSTPSALRRNATQHPMREH